MYLFCVLMCSAYSKYLPRQRQRRNNIVHTNTYIMAFETPVSWIHMHNILSLYLYMKDVSHFLFLPPSLSQLHEKLPFYVFFIYLIIAFELILFSSPNVIFSCFNFTFKIQWVFVFFWYSCIQAEIWQTKVYYFFSNGNCSNNFHQNLSNVYFSFSIFHLTYKKWCNCVC